MVNTLDIVLAKPETGTGEVAGEHEKLALTSSQTILSALALSSAVYLGVKMFDGHSKLIFLIEQSWQWRDDPHDWLMCFGFEVGVGAGV